MWSFDKDKVILKSTKYILEIDDIKILIKLISFFLVFDKA